MNIRYKYLNACQRCVRLRERSCAPSLRRCQLPTREHIQHRMRTSGTQDSAFPGLGRGYPSWFVAPCSTFEAFEVLILSCHMTENLVAILLLIEKKLRAKSDIRTVLGAVPVLSVKRAKVLWNSFVLVLDSKLRWWWNFKSDIVAAV